MSVLEPEAGIFYGLCWFVVILRFASRRLHLGAWKGLQLDDYLILLAMVRAPDDSSTFTVADVHARPQTPS
jgi:hypothetical protein